MKLPPAARAYALTASAYVSAAIPAAYLAANAALLLPAAPSWLRTQDRAWAALAACAALLTAAVGAACGWRKRALISEGLAVCEEKAWRLRAGHLTLWTLHLAHEPGPRDARQAWVVRGQVAAFFAFALALSGGAEPVWRGRAARQEAARRTAGRPVSLAEYYRGLPEARNGYRALRALVEKHRIDSYSLIRRPGLQMRRWDAGVAALERSTMTAHEEFLRRDLEPFLGKYDDLEAFDYRKAAAEPLDFNFGQFGGLVPLAGLLSEEAGLRAYSGQERAAWESVSGILRLARLTGRSPELLAKAVATAMAAQGARACLIVCLNRPGAVAPPEVARALASSAPRSYVREGLEADDARVFDLWRAPPCVQRKLLLETAFGDRVTALVLETATRAFHLDSLYLLVGLEDDEPLLAAADWETLRAAVAEQQRRQDASPLREIFGVFLQRPSRAMLLTRAYEAAAWSRLALAFSSLNAYRAARGAYPRRLEDLAPSYAPLDQLWDPFANRPFGYAAAEDGRGFELSSVGPFKTRADTGGRSLIVRERF